MQAFQRDGMVSALVRSSTTTRFAAGAISQCFVPQRDHSYDRLHVHDLHATVLSSLGVDHMELVYKHKGRPERATINEGVVCKKLFGA